ncbi:hypothetical protein [Thiocystis violacea]|uniref:hypothetical protein n=1 Tax=Thiocystis violacea TaxID=13725 RepID=UPI00190406C2|nr:hypothetical protein [Thiocystis violacea]MBK1719231.1 hypothetical protein [Thiocystis violacea]
MNPLIQSIGLSLLKKGLSILIRADLLNIIKDGVLILCNLDMDKEEKHKYVIQLVRDKEKKLAEDGVYDFEDRISTTLVDVAIKILYMAAQAGGK